jgi:hypothetical protein
MDIRTSDGVVFTLKDDFVQRSAVLKDMLADSLPSVVDIPFRSKMIWYLQQRDYPMDGAELLELAKTADFLNMEEELDESCRLVAETLKGKTAVEIKKFLGIS